ncbi:ABC-2 type transport system ATP-binding protein [Proteiniborus ethanoligenes]|uniref:ABC-2 type transport system ATP-binding protein n=1 Tax=Proteiniborus ethanoligenes TaxID=415015 RepID=A0A1H3PVE9_9FIRM|nr:ABC transporter ATP-binding protein [Proteiniborus ethanoligenes]SDZ05026.1 ABC-2 type transport system ATP-binding protein [Proteiniborus ethanoligenes]
MIRIENLTKKYGSFTAVDNLSLEIKEGEIFGFVGPNGAGKTTTLKMIATLLKPTSGSIYINDTEISKNIKEARNQIGYMPDFFGVYDNLKVNEYLEFYADIAGLNKEEKKKMIGDLLDLVDLTNKVDSYVDQLSRGMKQRLCLARSLIHNPSFLLLDEPASGMDPRARVQMKDILRELRKMGKTILISSHILPELAELCTSIGIIENGEMVISGTVDEIMKKVTGTHGLRIKVLDNIEKTVNLLMEEPLVSNIYENENIIEFSFDGGERESANLIKKLVAQDIPLASFNLLESNLEEIFMQVTKGDVEQ